MTSWLEMDTSSVLISITSQEAENPRIINEIMRVCQQSEPISNKLEMGFIILYIIILLYKYFKSSS